MKVLVTSQYRFFQTPDQKVWTTGAFPASFWQRYLAAFSEVQILARLRQVDTPPEKALRADAPSCGFLGIPEFVGPRQYLLSFRQTQKAIDAALKDIEGVILRLPCHLAPWVGQELLRRKHPFGVEVVGDPEELFLGKGTESFFQGFFRRYFTSTTTRLCRAAAAAAYVTPSVLQRRYPPAKDGFSTWFSSVELPDEAFLPAPRTFAPSKKDWKLVTVATLEGMHKGIDLLLSALAAARSQGLQATLAIIGDGRSRATLEALTTRLGLESEVTFYGQIPAGDAIRRHLDQSDLFLLPSWSEGLPRSILEAMSRGLPCIASRVGGIPEILANDVLFPPGDIRGLTETLLALTSSPAKAEEESQRNLESARLFAETRMHEKRSQFYNALCHASAPLLNTPFPDVPKKKAEIGHEKKRFFASFASALFS